jgi:hypothetical protein
MAALGGASLVTYSQFANAWKYVLGKPSIVVSSNGATMSGQESNLGADFGPDTPGTTTCGIQEAVDAVYKSATLFSGTGGPSVLMQGIMLSTGVFNVDSPITIPAPSPTLNQYGPNLQIWGNGLQNSIVIANFSGATNYLFNISADNNYGMFVLQDFSVNSGVGKTPGGWLNANFYYTANAAHANMVIRNVNVYPATWSSFSMVATGLIELVLENYWDTTNGTGQNGPYLGNTMTLWQGGSCYAQAILDNNYVFKAIAVSSLNIEINTGNGTYIFDSCVDVRIATSMGIASPIRFIELSNCIITNFVGASTNTIWAGQAGTITTLRIRNLTFGGSASGSLLNPFITVADYKLDGALVNTTAYTYTMPNIPGFSVTTPAVPASGSAAKNTNPFKVRLTVLTASGATATITDPSGTVGSSFPITAGQFIELDSNAQITPTYTTLTWQPYGC